MSSSKPFDNLWHFKYTLFPIFDHSLRYSDALRYSPCSSKCSINRFKNPSPHTVSVSHTRQHCLLARVTATFIRLWSLKNPTWNVLKKFPSFNSLGYYIIFIIDLHNLNLKGNKKVDWRGLKYLFLWVWSNHWNNDGFLLSTLETIHCWDFHIL